MRIRKELQCALKRAVETGEKWQGKNAEEKKSS